MKRLEPQSDELLSTGEVAKRLGVSTTTVQRYYDAGKLDGRVNYITGRRLISASSVTKLLREKRNSYIARKSKKKGGEFRGEGTD